MKKKIIYKDNLKQKYTLKILNLKKNNFKQTNLKKSNFFKKIQKYSQNNCLLKFAKTNLKQGKKIKFLQILLKVLLYLKKQKNIFLIYLYLINLIKIKLICQIKPINRRTNIYIITPVSIKNYTSIGLKLFFSIIVQRYEKTLKLKILNELLETCNLRSNTLIEKKKNYQLIYALHNNTYQYKKQ